jgi:phage-related protein
MLDNAKLGPEVFDSLGKGFRNLSETVGKISDLTDATVATNDYARNVKSASTAINDMNKSYGVAINAMSSMADATKDAQSYRDQFQQITKNMGALNAVYELELQDTTKHLKAMNAFYGNLTAAMENMADATKDAQSYREQFQQITKNMGALNAVYELELQDTTKHLKAMNAFYGNLTTAMENMADATKESQVFKNEMSRLTNNISSLNGIYGNMLTAMRGGNA